MVSSVHIDYLNWLHFVSLLLRPHSFVILFGSHADRVSHLFFALLSLKHLASHNSIKSFWHESDENLIERHCVFWVHVILNWKALRRNSWFDFESPANKAAAAWRLAVPVYPLTSSMPWSWIYSGESFGEELKLNFSTSTHREKREKKI